MTKTEAIAYKQIAEEQLSSARTALTNALSNGGVVEYSLQNGEDRRSVRMMSATELINIIKKLEQDIASYDRVIASYSGSNGFIIGGLV